MVVIKTSTVEGILQPSERHPGGLKITVLLDLLLNLGVVALGALAGSAFMWMFIGPIVLRRAGPRVVQDVLKSIFHISDDELGAQKGDLFRAVTHKQAETFAKSVYGALGNVVRAAPTEELEKLAKQHGFTGVEDAKAKLGGLTGGGAPGGLDVGALQRFASGNGKKNAFSGVVDLLLAINTLGAIGGVSDVQGVPSGAGAAPMPALTAGRSAVRW